jgi:hypothetical protein
LTAKAPFHSRASSKNNFKAFITGKSTTQWSKSQSKRTKYETGFQLQKTNSAILNENKYQIIQSESKKTVIKNTIKINKHEKRISKL